MDDDQLEQLLESWETDVPSFYRWVQLMSIDDTAFNNFKPYIKTVDDIAEYVSKFFDGDQDNLDITSEQYAAWKMFKAS